jgi:hypothetical protein
MSGELESLATHCSVIVSFLTLVHIVMYHAVLNPTRRGVAYCVGNSFSQC